GATYTYDAEGRKTAETVSYGDGRSLSYGYAYTPRGLVRQLVYPDGTQVIYCHAAHGELAGVSIEGEGSLNVNEWNWVAPKKITMPGGTVREMSHDGLLKLTGLTVKNPGQQTIFELANRFGLGEELREKVVTDTAEAGSNTVAQSYAYDA